MPPIVSSKLGRPRDRPSIYCLAGDTRILMANGKTRPLAELVPGDEIYGTVLRGWNRRYVKQRVLAQWRVAKVAYRVRLLNGTELVAGADHRFLTRVGWKFVIGVDSTGAVSRPQITTGDELVGSGVNAPAPVENQIVTSGARIQVGGVELAGTVELYDIATETENFISNGVVSHNCCAPALCKGLRTFMRQPRT